MKKLEILVYKRTHTGDPCDNGIFGERTCMGTVRDWEYDAVIGIGGKHPWPEDRGIALKVNWIGISPVRLPNPNYGATDRGKSWVAFDRFCLLDEQGPSLQKIAPLLYNHMYVECQRRFRKFCLSDGLLDGIYAELLNILALADSCSPSKGISTKEKLEMACSNRKCG
jgi:hypothetical protein